MVKDGIGLSPKKQLNQSNPKVTLSPSKENIIKTEANSVADIVCFSHLRWDFVFQRPQHLMSRFAKGRNVFYIEEPLIEKNSKTELREYKSKEGTVVLTPIFSEREPRELGNKKIAALLDSFFEERIRGEYLFWYYTPMALEFSRHFSPYSIVYDCMDELSSFKGAHPALLSLERELFSAASIVFTGGESLYQAKKSFHRNIFSMPSSIDKLHFESARIPQPDPFDQRQIPRPRFGFYGVIDERFDIDLLAKVANLRPDWHFVILGPVVKINPDSLPRNVNIHYLQGREYCELPAYLGNWDVAIMPFALNAATKYISPTKTPEFLAGGRPVVSTPITDVVTPYGDRGLVSIAANSEQFVACCQHALEQKNDQMRLHRVDKFLKDFSWDKTWSSMEKLINSDTYNHKHVSA